MIRILGSALLAALFALSPAHASDDTSPEAIPPTTDVSGLPPLRPEWHDSNPYRGNAAVLDTGRALYNEACARCHGVDANNRNHVGPNLLRLQRGCKKVTEPELKPRCEADVDHYFAKTVRQGKRVLDIQHMPAWEGVLGQEAVWAIRSFVESRSR
jgi:hypothetical protein